MSLGGALIDSGWTEGSSEIVTPFSRSRGVSGAGELAAVEVEGEAGRLCSSIAGKRRRRRRIFHRCESASHRAQDSKKRVRARMTTTYHISQGSPSWWIKLTDDNHGGMDMMGRAVYRLSCWKFAQEKTIRHHGRRTMS